MVVKVQLLNGSLSEYADGGITSDKCITVQKFNYQCSRNRNDAGIPYGNTTPSLLTFELRLFNEQEAKVFLSRLLDNDHYAYTFLFTASFSDSKVVNTYDSAMEVLGYVVDIDEIFSGTANGDQAILKVTLLISSVKYIGSGNNKVLDIINQ
ncbi:MAG: hypothetical protein K6F33_15535 [Bacteroidales bacterium]|nr:hypothetical protein [Bacteroidales bacterium]